VAIASGVSKYFAVRAFVFRVFWVLILPLPGGAVNVELDDVHGILSWATLCGSDGDAMFVVELAWLVDGTRGFGCEPNDLRSDSASCRLLPCWVQALTGMWQK
jgi:hypothetical protein